MPGLGRGPPGPAGRGPPGPGGADAGRRGAAGRRRRRRRGCCRRAGRDAGRAPAGPGLRAPERPTRPGRSGCSGAVATGPGRAPSGRRGGRCDRSRGGRRGGGRRRDGRRAGSGRGGRGHGRGGRSGDGGLLGRRLLGRRRGGVRERLTQLARDGGFDGGRGGLDVLADLAELGERFLAGDAELFGEGGYAGLAWHVTPSRRPCGNPRGPISRWTFSLLALHRVPIALHLLRGSAGGLAESALRVTYSRTGVGSIGPDTRSARTNARRRCASSTQSGSGCNHAPRPGMRRRGSGTTGEIAGAASPGATGITTMRSNSAAAARFRQPMQVRSGSAGPGGLTSTRNADGRLPSTLRRPSPSLLPGRAPAASTASGGGAAPVVASADARRACSASESLWMSIRAPVRRAASRAFCPSRPIASESWKSGTTTRTDMRGRVDDLAGAARGPATARCRRRSRGPRASR